MVCSECGSHNRDEARFCASCGSVLALAPDMELWFEALAGDDEHIALRWAGRGHAAAGAGGNPMEYVVALVVALRNGRSARVEMFDAREDAAALARLEELSRATA